ncbi:unnamed protein product [Cuscuta campestris]|uniref:Uncharacterized protein n=1 Tax=Cuscuta campestris TaxID=132261 RepID=A0A484M270_9ASTE|nr:unnamed protein product [Cuscuta campestris]
MTVSILEDPAVSRVFGEAGFTSCDIMVALLRLVHQFFRYSTYKNHPSPLFLCNLSMDSNLGRRDFTFPFLGNPAILEGDKNCRRIWEVLEKTNKKNPLLVGKISKILQQQLAIRAPTPTGITKLQGGKNVRESQRVKQRL